MTTTNDIQPTRSPGVKWRRTSPKGKKRENNDGRPEGKNLARKWNRAERYLPQSKAAGLPEKGSQKNFTRLKETEDYWVPSNQQNLFERRREYLPPSWNRRQMDEKSLTSNDSQPGNIYLGKSEKNRPPQLKKLKRGQKERSLRRDSPKVKGSGKKKEESLALTTEENTQEGRRKIKGCKGSYRNLSIKKGISYTTRNKVSRNGTQARRVYFCQYPGQNL